MAEWPGESVEPEGGGWPGSEQAAPTEGTLDVNKLTDPHEIEYARGKQGQISDSQIQDDIKQYRQLNKVDNGTPVGKLPTTKATKPTIQPASYGVLNKDAAHQFSIPATYPGISPMFSCNRLVPSSANILPNPPAIPAAPLSNGPPGVSAAIAKPLARAFCPVAPIRSFNPNLGVMRS